MATLKIKAPIYSIDPVDYSNSEYPSQKIRLNCTTFNSQTGAEYPNYPSFTFGKKHLEQISLLKASDEVEVSFFPKGVRYIIKSGDKVGQVGFFESNNAFGIELTKPAQQDTPIAPPDDLWVD